MEANKKNKYFAFISYKREDEEWAVWFHHELENYHLPATLNGRTDLPTEFRPIFRDIDELKAGNLPEQIYNALASSAFLVVICSPDPAKSEWVNKEIMDFIEIGKSKGIDNVRNIFPFIVDGRPHAKSQTEECFPSALLNLPKNQERIGGNINEGHRDWTGDVKENGADKAFVKVLAGMLPNVAFDELWNRYERDKAEEERKKREERNKLLISQSRFAAEKANEFVEEGDSYSARRLLLEVMPMNLEQPDRPYVIEAENALRNACKQNLAILKSNTYCVRSASYSPDGKRIVSTALDNSVKIWDSETGKEILSLQGFSCRGILHGTLPAVYSPDCKRIASVSYDNTIKIWDAETGRILQSLAGHSGPVYYAYFSPNSHQIVSSSEDKTIRVWDVETGKEIKTLIGLLGLAAFCPDGKRVVFASIDKSKGIECLKTIGIWDWKTGKTSQSMVKNASVFTPIAFSFDGEQVAYALNTNIIRIQNVETGELIQSLTESSSSIKLIAFSSNGKLIASAKNDHSIKIWNIESGKTIQTFDGLLAPIGSVGFSPDGKHIIAAVNDSIRIWDVESSFIGHTNSVNSICFSPKGNQIASASSDNTIKVWDIKLGKDVLTMTGHYAPVDLVAFSPDGKRLVSASRDNSVIIWDAITGNSIQTIACSSNNRIISVNFDPYGNPLITYYQGENIIRVYNVKTQTGHLLFNVKALMKGLIAGSSFPVPLAFSKDGKLVAFSDKNATIVITDLETETELLTINGQDDMVTSVPFSPNGKYIASSSFSIEEGAVIRIWDMQTGKRIHTILGHSDYIDSIAFSPNGKQIVSDSKDKTIRVWDIKYEKELLQLSDFKYPVFSPDGKKIALITYDDSIQLLSFPPLQELIDQTRERFKDRPLTMEERRQYYLE